MLGSDPVGERVPNLVAGLFVHTHPSRDAETIFPSRTVRSQENVVRAEPDGVGAEFVEVETAAHHGADRLARRSQSRVIK